LALVGIFVLLFLRHKKAKAASRRNQSPVYADEDGGLEVAGHGHAMYKPEMETHANRWEMEGQGGMERRGPWEMDGQGRRT
jgi:hypothetical protein